MLQARQLTREGPKPNNEHLADSDTQPASADKLECGQRLRSQRRHYPVEPLLHGLALQDPSCVGPSPAPCNQQEC